MKNKGFTTLELLTVIAMIGILLSAVLAAIGSAKKNIDSKKALANLQRLQSSLEEYKAQCGSYPMNLDANTSNTSSSPSACSVSVSTIMGTIDTTGVTYIAMKSAQSQNQNLCQAYHLGVVLPEESNEFANDRDWAPGTGIWTTCDPAASFSMPPLTYDVTSPGVADTGATEAPGEPLLIVQ